MIPDAIYEGPSETATLTISNPSGGITLGSTASLDILLVDNEMPPTITVNDLTVSEDAGTASFMVSLSQVSGLDTRVSCQTASDSATADEDYTGISATVLTIPSGSPSGEVTVTVTDDETDESDETFTLDLSQPVNAMILDNHGTCTITDNDSKPEIVFALTDSSFSENSGTCVVMAVASVLPHYDVTIALEFSGTAVKGIDYTASDDSLIIPAGSISSMLTLTGIDDTENEADEKVIIDIVSVTNGTESGTQQISTAVTDDDAIPAVSFAVADQSGSEDTGDMIMSVQLSAPSYQDINVPFTFGEQQTMMITALTAAC